MSGKPQRGRWPRTLVPSRGAAPGLGGAPDDSEARSRRWVRAAVPSHAAEKHGRSVRKASGRAGAAGPKGSVRRACPCPARCGVTASGCPARLR